jgi:acetyl esterase/lipase
MEALKTLLPMVPGLAKTSFLATFGLHPTSSKWDATTTITVWVVRNLLFNPTTSISKLQKSSAKHRAIKGKLWAARTIIPKPTEQTIPEVIFQAIEDMGDGREEYTKPDVASFEAEWIGFRADAKDEEEEAPELGEKEKYELLMQDETRTSSCTVLYLHGGGYYMCGCETHRETASKVAKGCGGRALLIEYRLAPQTAFPGQLIDALNAYLYLLYPPEGSFHAAVLPSDIVFAGDSAGANLAASLMQLLLHMQRTKTAGEKSPTITYHGKVVEVPLPAGMATLSGWFDVTRSMPSVKERQMWDYLGVIDHDKAYSQLPKDDIWPTSPPRGDPYCELSLLCHPLVSPLTVKDWSASPPMFFMTGEEMLSDEDKILAGKAAEQGVTVVWEQYEAMPHVFTMIFPALKNSVRCLDSVGRFARSCVEGNVESSATLIAFKTGTESRVEMAELTRHLTWEDALGRMKDAQSRRISGYKRRCLDL